MLRTVWRRRTILRIRRQEPFITELERNEYNKIVTKSGKINSQFYNEQQSHIENKFIKDFEEKERRKKLFDDLKLRTDLIRRAWEDRKELNANRETEQERKRKLKCLIFERISRKQHRKRILKALDAESQSWISCNKGKVVAPDIFSTQSSYFAKLQERAMLASEGNFDQLDDYHVENDVLDYKNLLLLPLFGKIKNFIKLLLDSPFSQLLLQWRRIDSSLSINTPLEQRKEIKDTYKKLLTMLHAKYAAPEKRFELLEKKIQFLYLLLEAWSRYTKILLLSHEEVRTAMKLEIFIENKATDPVKAHETYQMGLKKFFSTQGESLTDMEQMFSPISDIEELVKENADPIMGKEEFHQILSNYISPEDIHAFEDEFDQLRQQYDSIYGEPTFNNPEKEESLFTDDHLRLIFESKPISNEFEMGAEESFTPLSDINSSFFGRMLLEKVNSFEGTVSEEGWARTRKMAEKIAQMSIEEAGLLRKIIDNEINSNLLLSKDI